MSEPNGDPYEEFWAPAYETWTPCEDRTPEEIEREAPDAVPE